MKVGGIVLCGGRSTRMGRPKAWLPLGGETLLARVVRLVSEAVDPVVVVAAPGQDTPPLPDHIAIVRDQVKGRGPLQGLSAGLQALQGRVDAAYLCSCDAPFLHPPFVRRLIERIGDAVACAPFVEGRRHPLAAVYRLTALDVAARMLAEDRLRAIDFLDAVPTRLVQAAELTDVDPDLQTLRNLNTPEEYEAALRLAEAGR